jgi:hypothetical protein
VIPDTVIMNSRLVKSASSGENVYAEGHLSVFGRLSIQASAIFGTGLVGRKR